jgi:ornithine cyclodeaminase/alanine dehydrogenase-like protein (mu-crystallin family)
MLTRLDFDSVHAHAGVADLIAPLRHAFAEGMNAPARNHYELGTPHSANSLLVMPGWRAGGHLGVKIVTVFPDNEKRGLCSVNGEYLLISGDTGEPLALLDGRALTLLRTAAVAALAADLLAAPDADNLLMVGTGALAAYLIEGHLAVRRFKSIGVWGRTPAKAIRLVNRLLGKDLPVRLVPHLETAAREADVICSATMATSPLIEGRWLKAHAHLNLIGSFRPSMREADADCFRDSLVAVDTPDALEESGELIEPLRSGIVRPAQIVQLRDLVVSGVPATPSRKSVFKSVGSALADLSAAEWIYQRCRERSAR